MPVWILEILGSKYFWMIAGVLAVLTGTYLKGRKDANASNKEAQQEAKDKQEADIKQAEKTNQDIDKEGEKNVQTINDAKSMSDVIKLLNSLFKTKD